MFGREPPECDFIITVFSRRLPKPSGMCNRWQWTLRRWNGCSSSLTLDPGFCKDKFIINLNKRIGYEINRHQLLNGFEMLGNNSDGNIALMVLSQEPICISIYRPWTLFSASESTTTSRFVPRRLSLQYSSSSDATNWSANCHAASLRVKLLYSSFRY